MIEIGSCEWCGEFCGDTNVPLGLIHQKLIDRPTDKVLLKQEQAERARAARPVPLTADERAERSRQARIRRAPAAIDAAAVLEARRRTDLDAAAGRFNGTSAAYWRGRCWRGYFEEEVLRLLDLDR